MSDRSRVIAGRVLASVAVTSAIAGCLWVVLVGATEALWDDYLVHNAVVAVGFGAMVWTVIPAQPRNRVVWVAAVAAVMTGFPPLLTALFYQLLPDTGVDTIWSLVPADLPTGLALAGMAFNSTWMGLMLVPTLVVLHLPDGRPPSPRWRWLSRLVWSLWAAAIVGFAWGARPSVLSTFGEIQAYQLAGASWTNTLSFIGFVGIGATIPFCVVGMVVRFRQSTGEERQQLRWVAWGASLAGPLLVAAIGFEIVGNIAVVLALLAMSLVILVGSLAVSIGKYRLYDVDVVINRTVVFAVLVGFIAMVYGAVVVGIGSALGGGGEGWAPILATAVVALAFEPVRHLAQRWANRIAYGHRATPYEVLSDLTERLTGSGEGGEILDRMAALLVDGTGAEQATVWLGSPGEMRPVATTGVTADVSPVDPSAETVFPVVHDGETVGALEVVKPRGTALSSQEKALMSDLAGSAGAVFGYQRLNESLALTAREIESSRRRLVEAEDEERRRLEHELNEGAQQLILALKVNIGLARRVVAESGSPGLVALFHGLVEEAHGALDEVRNLAKGIYPPVLESDGLGPAVSALAAGMPVEVDVSRDGIGRYSREVEAAVYFDVSEALTNAAKHATPPIRVNLAEEDEVLKFTVSDSGPGFDPGVAGGGSGMENMRDRVEAIGGRIEIASAPGSVTTVAGEIPIGDLRLTHH